MKLRRIASLSVATLMALNLCACGSKSETAATATTAAATTAAAVTEAATTAAPAEAATEAAGVDRSQELIIYSNSTSNGQGDWLIEKAAEAGFNLNVVSVDGSALSDRLMAEKNNPICDVVFGMNAVEYERLKTVDLLADYEPEWADKVDMALGDSKDGLYYPIIIQPLYLMYNKDVVSNPPAAWEDLADPQYEGQFNMFKLSGGTAKMITAAILSRYQDPAGEYGVSEEGWSLIESIYANCHYQQDGEDYVGNVVDGTIPMSEMWGAGVIKHQKQREVEFGLMKPEYGNPFVVEQLAIINGTDKYDLAVDFINWFGSAEQMKGWSDNAGAIPANQDALAMVDDPTIKDMIATTEVQDVDWGFVAANVNDWVEKIELEYLE